MQHNQNTGHLLLLTSPALLSRSLLYSSLWSHPRTHLPLVSATSHKPHVLSTRTITIGQCCTHFLYLLCSIGSPYFLFASFLSRGCIRVRFLRLNFLTFQKNEYSASYDPLSYYEAGRYCTSQMPAVYFIPLQSLFSSSTASTRSTRYVQTAKLQHTASTGY